ncbi:PAS domain-containing sensor histidine kinase [Sulfurospirillum sp. UCH001]|jgi:two-component system NtrC family sensor kinase/two-component system sensor histidine kinase AtoS|uniref:sensor histidine kinase n=1 Tax=Sulfurospirillum sp. UCH001 TaxID=1581011 RepID=UPI00082C8DDA|nr:ATP-binding protein [Sulfurospirillum sp. UCH001]
MIDETLLNSLSAKEKELFKQGLEDLINQTYVIEDEYKKLGESYTALQDFIRQIIEVQPNALWVFDNDGAIFLQNSEAKKIGSILEGLSLEEESEVDFEGRSYLIKSVTKSDKKIITATDITEGKRQERLVSMGQVAAHLSHEIRNPIGSVSLLASTLLKKVDPNVKPLVTEIKKAIWRVERIIKATLLFTKSVQINPSFFYLDRLIKECEQAISHYSYTKEVAFHFDLPHVEIKADFELLNLVLQNFIFNAIDAIEECEKESGNVSISFVEDSEYVILHVKDDGKPIENKNILFEPFKTTKTKGNGLGLALSLQIIQAHNGKINLLEEPKGFEIKIAK